MVNEKILLIFLRFLIEPEFILRDEMETVMLSVIRKLYVDIVTDVRTVNDPNGYIPSLVYLFQIRGLEGIYRCLRFNV
jgi:hypothetical protein